NRALPATVLGDYLSSNGVSAIECPMDYTQAVRAALNTSSGMKSVPLVVVGSMYMVASIREELKLPDVSVW
ncbi:MAG: hypothetical protein KDD55_08075, partial [Bdellovibrionales bacterium]|nr:hypothetical protein [Bdellovibrionales bacterium]